MVTSPPGAPGDPRTTPERADLARLTRRAELIVEELDTVVQELSTLLRQQAGHD